MYYVSFTRSPSTSSLKGYCSESIMIFTHPIPLTSSLDRYARMKSYARHRGNKSEMTVTARLEREHNPQYDHVSVNKDIKLASVLLKLLSTLGQLRVVAIDVWSTVLTGTYKSILYPNSGHGLLNWLVQMCRAVG